MAAGVGPEDGDLDALVRRVDPDRWLASRFIADPQRREDVIAVYAYDHELARARTVASNPLIAEIRLTWWREVLDEIEGDRTVRAHPGALALAAAVRRHQLPRAPLEAMIDARIETIVQAPATEDEAAAWARDVGGSAMSLAARILDPSIPAPMTENAGIAWGLLMLRRQGGAEARDVIDPALRQHLSAAKAESRKVSPAAFPAIAAVSLAANELKGRRPTGLQARLRLLSAVVRGSI